MVGLFEGEGAVWNVDTIPGDSSFTEIQPDWERMTPYLPYLTPKVAEHIYFEMAGLYHTYSD
eukprot:COSAG05_NODE_812_length_7171_cov_13.392534_3_plen_62_part_00